MFDIHLEYWPVTGGTATQQAGVIRCESYQIKDGNLALTGLRGWVQPEMYFPLALVKVWWVTESEWDMDIQGK